MTVELLFLKSPYAMADQGFPVEDVNHWEFTDLKCCHFYTNGMKLSKIWSVGGGQPTALRSTTDNNSSFTKRYLLRPKSDQACFILYTNVERNDYFMKSKGQFRANNICHCVLIRENNGSEHYCFTAIKITLAKGKETRH